MKIFDCYVSQVCSNVNKCYCAAGWSGNDCSIPISIASTTTTLLPTPLPDKTLVMVKIETPYGKKFRTQSPKNKTEKNPFFIDEI